VEFFNRYIITCGVPSSEYLAEASAPPERLGWVVFKNAGR
jgi:hypothetical protein